MYFYNNIVEKESRGQIWWIPCLRYTTLTSLYRLKIINTIDLLYRLKIINTIDYRRFCSYESNIVFVIKYNSTLNKA